MFPESPSSKQSVGWRGSISDGGYAEKSWKEMITSGISADKKQQKHSLAWIREQSMNSNCIESLANHDPDVKPHVIEF